MFAIVRLKMTEGRIRVTSRDIIEFDAPISDEQGFREKKLNMFDPPIKVEHGKHRKDPIVLYQGKIQHEVRPGGLSHFKLQDKIIEVAHKGEIYKFK